MIQLKSKSQMYIFVVSLILLGLGLVMVASSSMYLIKQNPYHYLVRQTIWICIGIVGMIWIMHMDYQEFRKHSKLLLFISAILLVGVFIPGLGKNAHGASRWIGWGPIQFQPSEFAKLVLVIYMADVLSRKQEKEIIRFKSGFLPIMIIMGTISLLVVIEPDLGTAVVMCVLVWTLCLIAGVRKVHLFSVISFSIPFVVYQIMTHRHQLIRLIVFLNPEANPEGAGYQINQSLIAIGSGGFWGRGLGESLQKYGFLPDIHTDFIFSLICEELGFIGATVVLLLFGFLIFQGLRVAVRSRDLFAALLASGVTLIIAAQTAINTGMATSILPTKGMPLPFISYGGSSVVFILLAIGILLNVAQYVPELYKNIQND